MGAAVKAQRVPPSSPETISLTDISLEDAAILLALIGSIGGEPDGPRGAIQRVREALIAVRSSSANARVYNNIEIKAVGDLGGALYLNWKKA